MLLLLMCLQRRFRRQQNMFAPLVFCTVTEYLVSYSSLLGWPRHERPVKFRINVASHNGKLLALLSGIFFWNFLELCTGQWLCHPDRNVLQTSVNRRVFATFQRENLIYEPVSMCEGEPHITIYDMYNSVLSVIQFSVFSLVTKPMAIWKL